jgi:hypothetical protein
MKGVVAMNLVKSGRQGKPRSRQFRKTPRVAIRAGYSSLAVIGQESDV